MKLTQLGKDSFLYILSSLLVRGIQILLMPVYTKTLGTGQYGIVELVTICGALINLTIALEISQGMARYLADSSDLEQRKSYASTAIGFSLAAYTLFTIFTCIWIDNVNLYLFSNSARPEDLRLAILAIGANGVFTILLELLRWEIKPLSYMLSSMAYALSCLVAGFCLVYIYQTGISGVFGGQLAGAVIGGAVGFACARKLLLPTFNFIHLKQMLKFSAPLTLSSFAVFISVFADRLIVREALGLDALGIYGFAARMASIISVLTLGLQSALTPLIYKHWQLASTRLKLAFVTKVYLVLMTPVIGGIALFASELTLLLSGEAFYEARLVLPILGLSAFLSSLYIFSPGLFLGKCTSIIALINIGGAILNLSISSWLTPRYGIIAAAGATLFSSSMVLLSYVLFGKRYFPVQFEWGRLAGIMISMLFLILLSIQLQPGALYWSLSDIITKLILLALIFILLARYCLNHTEKQRLLDVTRNYLPFIRRGNHQK